MEVKLNPKIIAENIPDYEEFSDCGTSELYLMILKLKTAILSDGPILVNKNNKHKQICVDDLWYNDGEYEIL